jgi:hypothetical protein
MDKRSSHINAVDKEQEQPEQEQKIAAILPQQHKQPRIWAINTSRTTTATTHPMANSSNLVPTLQEAATDNSVFIAR